MEKPRVVLKRLTVEELRCHGIKMNHGMTKTAQEVRKRKRDLEPKIVNVTQDLNGKNTRSKTRALTETNNDTDSSSTSVYPHGKRKKMVNKPIKVIDAAAKTNSTVEKVSTRNGKCSIHN